MDAQRKPYILFHGPSALVLSAVVIRRMIVKMLCGFLLSEAFGK